MNTQAAGENLTFNEVMLRVNELAGLKYSNIARNLLLFLDTKATPEEAFQLSQAAYNIGRNKNATTPKRARALFISCFYGYSKVLPILYEIAFQRLRDDAAKEAFMLAQNQKLSEYDLYLLLKTAGTSDAVMTFNGKAEPLQMHVAAHALQVSQERHTDRVCRHFALLAAIKTRRGSDIERAAQAVIKKNPDKGAWMKYQEHCRWHSQFFEI